MTDFCLQKGIDRHFSSHVLSDCNVSRRVQQFLWKKTRRGTTRLLITLDFYVQSYWVLVSIRSKAHSISHDPNSNYEKCSHRMISLAIVFNLWLIACLCISGCPFGLNNNLSRLGSSQLFNFPPLVLASSQNSLLCHSPLLIRDLRQTYQTDEHSSW